MFTKLIENFKRIDKLAFKIMKHGLKFCFFICILSVIILFTYTTSFPSPIIYYIGLNLLKLSLVFGIEFIICGFVVDGIKNQLV